MFQICITPFHFSFLFKLCFLYFKLGSYFLIFVHFIKAVIISCFGLREYIGLFALFGLNIIDLEWQGTFASSYKIILSTYFSIDYLNSAIRSYILVENSVCVT